MTIGLKDLVFADITEGEGGVPTYGRPESLAEAINADLSVTVAEAVLYANDTVSENIKEFVKGVLKLGVKDLIPEKLARLLGQTLDDDQVIYSSSTDEAPWKAIGFRARKSGNTYKYVWLYKVKFKVPNEKYQTKGESITFTTPEIEGDVVARHDGLWKCDYVGAETTEVATTWLTEVREPHNAEQ